MYGPLGGSVKSYDTFWFDSPVGAKDTIIYLTHNSAGGLQLKTHTRDLFKMYMEPLFSNVQTLLPKQPLLNVAETY